MLRTRKSNIEMQNKTLFNFCTKIVKRHSVKYRLLLHIKIVLK